MRITLALLIAAAVALAVYERVTAPNVRSGKPAPVIVNNMRSDQVARIFGKPRNPKVPSPLRGFKCALYQAPSSYLPTMDAWFVELCVQTEVLNTPPS